MLQTACHDHECVTLVSHRPHARAEFTAVWGGDGRWLRVSIVVMRRCDPPATCFPITLTLLLAETQIGGDGRCSRMRPKGSGAEKRLSANNE